MIISSKLLALALLMSISFLVLISLALGVTRYFDHVKAREEAEREAVRERFKKRAAAFIGSIESERGDE